VKSQTQTESLFQKETFSKLKSRESKKIYNSRKTNLTNRVNKRQLQVGKKQTFFSFLFFSLAEFFSFITSL